MQGWMGSSSSYEHRDQNSDPSITALNYLELQLQRDLLRTIYGEQSKGPAGHGLSIVDQQQYLRVPPKCLVSPTLATPNWVSPKSP